MELPNTLDLSEWSIQRIKSIFESSTDEDSLHGPAVHPGDTDTATLNGALLPCAGIIQLVLAMRNASKTGLGVTWHHTVEVSRDASTNWACSLSIPGEACPIYSIFLIC
jgi:hypothetical protein